MRQPRKHAKPAAKRTKISGPERPRAAAPLPVAVATDGGSDSSSTLIPVIFGVAIALALMVIALALMPAQAVPRPLSNVVEEHGGDLLIAGVTAILSILVSLLITHAGS